MVTKLSEAVPGTCSSMPSRKKTNKAKEKTLYGKKATPGQIVFDRADMVRDVR
jgi:hypothetical protein